MGNSYQNYNNYQDQSPKQKKKFSLGLFIFIIIGMVVLYYIVTGIYPYINSPENPLEDIKQEYDPYPQYSVILEDMKDEGTSFVDYFHKYKILYAEKDPQTSEMNVESKTTDWLPVPVGVYDQHFSDLGMTILSKTDDGNVYSVAQPPGYNYVGNERYGQWRTDRSGNSFWEFYGKYAFISSLVGMGSRSIFRNDYNQYRNYRSSGRPYYGSNLQYGTYGQTTRAQSTSTFNQRVQSRQGAFDSRVQSRLGRSSSSLRSRSGGFGK